MENIRQCNHNELKGLEQDHVCEQCGTLLILESRTIYVKENEFDGNDYYCSDCSLKSLWKEFANTPVIINEDNEEVIDEDFFIWRKGTDKYHIWKWFDINHSKGLAKGIMHLEE
jgi:ssDNA-binding Zn-finger/Zn-ribbon topoisomerase 1